jgi:hypothetical protein
MADTQEVQTPAVGTPEHDAAMAAKFDGTAATKPQDDQAQGTSEPELILGKFKSNEDLLKAYQELEAKQGAVKPEDTQNGDEDTQNGDDAAAAVTKAGLDFGALETEYAEHGELTADSLKKLEDAGIPKAVVDMYIQGREALVSKLQSTAYEIAGGEDSYGSMTQWAAANMSEAEINAFNQAVNSTDPNVIKLAVAGLKGRYEASNGSEPDLTGGDLGASSGPVFESWAQVREAMRDPKYAKDPAYRNTVEQRLARSNPI